MFRNADVIMRPVIQKNRAVAISNERARRVQRRRTEERSVLGSDLVLECGRAGAFAEPPVTDGAVRQHARQVCRRRRESFSYRCDRRGPFHGGRWVRRLTTSRDEEK